MKLESTIHDSQLTATIDLDPSRGLKDEREMSSTLVTTEAGSAAAGFEGVSEGATGNPRQGQPNPVPLPANPLPESLQYVTVYDNNNQRRLRGVRAAQGTAELPLRLQQDARGAQQLGIVMVFPRHRPARRAALRGLLPAVLLACALLAAGARPAAAVIVPAVTLDGPSEDIVGFGGVAMAEDGTGGAVYLKRVDGVAHVFVARYVGRPLAGADAGRQRRAVRGELAANRRGERGRAGRRVGDAVRHRTAAPGPGAARGGARPRIGQLRPGR